MTLYRAIELQNRAEQAISTAKRELDKAHRLMIQATTAYHHIAQLSIHQAETNESATVNAHITELIALADEAQQDIVREIQYSYKNKDYFILPYDLLKDMIDDDTISASRLQLKLNLPQAKISLRNIHPMFTSTRGLKVFKNSLKAQTTQQ